MSELSSDDAVSSSEGQSTPAGALLANQDILGLILPFLGPEELLVAERVSRAWRSVTIATGQWLFLAGSTKVNVNLRCCIRTGTRVNCVTHHPSMPLLLCGLHNGWVQLYSSQTGDIAFEIAPDTMGNGVRTVCFAAEQACVAGTEDGSMVWWSLVPIPEDGIGWALRLQRRWVAHNGAVLCSCVHGALAYVFSGGEDHAIRCWDVHLNATLLCEFRGHTGAVTALVPHPLQVAIISGSADQSTCVWDITALAAPQILSTDVSHSAKVHLRHPAPVRALSAKPGRDGTWDLFVSLPGGPCLVWCVQDGNGQRLTAKLLHSGGANAAVLTDGFWVTAGEDCKVRFWHPLVHHSLGSTYRLLHGPVFSLSVLELEIAVGCSQGLLMGDIVLKRTQSDVSEAKKRLFKHRRPRGNPPL